MLDIIAMESACTALCASLGDRGCALLGDRGADLQAVAHGCDAPAFSAQQSGVQVYCPDRPLGLALEAFPTPQILWETAPRSNLPRATLQADEVHQACQLLSGESTSPFWIIRHVKLSAVNVLYLKSEMHTISGESVQDMVEAGVSTLMSGLAV